MRNLLMDSSFTEPACRHLRVGIDENTILIRKWEEISKTMVSWSYLI